MRLLTSSPYGALNRIFELVGDPLSRGEGCHVRCGGIFPVPHVSV